MIPLSKIFISILNLRTARIITILFIVAKLLTGCTGYHFSDPIQETTLAFDAVKRSPNIHISYHSDFVSYIDKRKPELQRYNRKRESEFASLIKATNCCLMARPPHEATVDIKTKIRHKRLQPAESIQNFLYSAIFYLIPSNLSITVTYEAYVKGSRGLIHYYKFSEAIDQKVWLPMIFWTSRDSAESGYDEMMKNFHKQLINSLREDAVI